MRNNERMAISAVAVGWWVLAAVAAVGLTGCGRAPQAPKAGDVETITLPGGATMEMVWCPPGTFMMGSPEDEKGRDDDEPQHLVRFPEGFWMAKTEVTQKQWESVMGEFAGLVMDRGADLPVAFFGGGESWKEFQEFCQKAGNGLRLPTEEEWEYACRAGSSGPYAGTGKAIEMGWYFDGHPIPAHPVGQKKPNAWGLYDMHGNASEWCTSSSGMVVRGGSHDNLAGECRSAARALPGEKHSFTIGFRPVCPGKAEARAKAAGTGGKKTLRERLGGIADTKGKGAKMKLYGMFGARLGEVMPESEVCKTNTLGERVYAHTPKKPLDGFWKYELHATPITRKIYAIVAWGAKDERLFMDTTRLLEERFGQAAVHRTPDVSGFKFPNDRIAGIAPEDGQLVILVIDSELANLAKQELGELEDEMLAEDIRILALAPERNGDEPLNRINSVFGVIFGEPCRWGREPEENNELAWVYTFEPMGDFMGCSEYRVFATAKSKRVFMVRVLFVGNSDDEAQDKYDQMRRMLERRTGKEFKDTAAEGNNKSCRMDIGSHSRIILEKYGDSDAVMLDFTDVDIAKAHAQEVSEKASRLLEEDLRVLALRPARQGLEALDRLDSVFGVVFGEPCRWGRNPEENDAHAWSYTFEPEGAFMGCSKFFVFATAQSKRVFMVRAVFAGGSDEEAQDKYDQMRRMLTILVGKEFKDTAAEGNNKFCRMDIGSHFCINLAKLWQHDKVMLDFFNVDLFAENEQEAAQKNLDDWAEEASRILEEHMAAQKNLDDWAE